MARQATEQADIHAELLAAVQRYLNSFKGDTPARISALRSSCSYTHLTPADLPVQANIKACLSDASENSSPLIRAIYNARLNLKWQQSYTAEDGFDEYYLNHYGWFNLISPDGPFKSEKIRISFAYWGADLDYKEHWHEPEETYFVLAGRAIFYSEGVPARVCGADDFIHHYSNQHHRIQMQPGPLLAMAIWEGQNLSRKPAI